jgi:hypothetical protein
LQTNFTIFRIVYLFDRQIVQLIISLRGAFVLMETFIFLHAFFITVAHSLTPAVAFEDIFLIAPFALTKLMALLFHIPQMERNDLSQNVLAHKLLVF